MAVSLEIMFAQLVKDMQDPDSNWARMNRGELLATGGELKEPSRWEPRSDGRNAAHQHIPGFVSGFDLEDLPFDTLEELLAMPFVARWTERPKFHRFSLDRVRGFHLMAEIDNGWTWWVVAILDRDVPELPGWVAKPVDQI